MRLKILRNKIKYGPQGLSFDVMQFSTQFTPVSRQYRASNRKQKINFRKNCL